MCFLVNNTIEIIVANIYEVSAVCQKLYTPYYIYSSQHPLIHILLSPFCRWENWLKEVNYLIHSGESGSQNQVLILESILNTRLLLSKPVLHVPDHPTPLGKRQCSNLSLLWWQQQRTDSCLKVKASQHWFTATPGWYQWLSDSSRRSSNWGSKSYMLSIPPVPTSYYSINHQTALRLCSLSHSILGYVIPLCVYGYIYVEDRGKEGILVNFSRDLGQGQDWKEKTQGGKQRLWLDWFSETPIP